MGIVEVGLVLPRFIRAFRKLREAAVRRSPDAVVLVDWPEFNLRLASALHRRGLKVIYYISPQLWAWRPGRVSKIKENIDLLLSILPFEVDWYKAHGVDHVEFVGHPLSGEVEARFGREEFCRRNGLDPTRPIVSFLPGSRQKELERILPPMLDAIEELRTVRPEVQAVVVVAPSRTVEETYALISHRQSNGVKLVQQQTREALGASYAAAVASGTATLEAALLDTDGCCLQGVARELAHAWTADFGATLWTRESRGGKGDCERINAGRPHRQEPAPGTPETPRP
jgi:lipid-A-disaccharide synthase